MGTSGFVGFVVDGVEKFTVIGGDSFPSSVGIGVLSWLTQNRNGGFAAQVRALRLVPAAVEPDERDLDRVRDTLRDSPYEDFADASTEEVLEFAAYDVGTLLRGGLALDGTDFPLDSLFCEWGYLIDLDAGMFEVYRGMQTAPPAAGRFVGRPAARAGHFPMTLVASWPLTALPDPETFMALPDAY